MVKASENLVVISPVFLVEKNFMVVTVIGIVVVAAGISFLSAIRIRKIEPVKMLLEE